MSTEQLLSEIRTLEIKVEAQSRRKRALQQRREQLEHLERQIDRLEEARLKLEKRKLQIELDAEYGLDDDDEINAIGERLRLVDTKMETLRAQADSIRATTADDEVSTIRSQLRRKLGDLVVSLRADGRYADATRYEHKLEEMATERRQLLRRTDDLLLEARNHLVRAAAELDAIEAVGAAAEAATGVRQRAALYVRASARAFREAWESLVEAAATWDDARTIAVEKDWLALPFEAVTRGIQGPPTEEAAASEPYAAPKGLPVGVNAELKALTLWVNERRARVSTLSAERSSG